MEKTAFTFPFQDGKEYTVTIEGRNDTDEGLCTFEKCNGDTNAIQAFKSWLSIPVNITALSQFIKERTEFLTQVHSKK